MSLGYYGKQSFDGIDTPGGKEGECALVVGNGAIVVGG